MPSELINVDHPFYNSPSVHLAMLKDNVRVFAFQKALKELIKPGETTVLEIGTGTGILSLISASLGAKSVFATESANGMIEISKKSFLKNKVGHNINLIPIEDTTPILPKSVDIIMSECLGHFAFDENMVRVVSSLKPLLNEGGHFIPRNIRLCIASTNSSDIFSSFIEPWNKKMFGFDFSHLKTKAVQQIYVKTFFSENITSLETEIINYHVGDSINVLKGNAKLLIKSSGLIYGLVGWFEAELAENVWLSTSPFLSSTHWEQVFLPFEEPLNVKAGTKLNVDLSIQSSQTNNNVTFTWKVDDGTNSSIQTTVII
jgi:protein arginine N-methyltransferase 1